MGRTTRNVCHEALLSAAGTCIIYKIASSRVMLNGGRMRDFSRPTEFWHKVITELVVIAGGSHGT